MRKLAHTAPAPRIRELPKIEAVPDHRSSRIMPRKIKNEVRAPRWMGYANGKGHAFLIPAGPIGRVTVKGVCGRIMDAERLVAAKGERCKSCASAMAEDTRKRGTGLTEPTVDIVDTGAAKGDPREAELRRVAELAPISGDAGKRNAEIVGVLREGRPEDAKALAKALDRQGTSAPVPDADRAPIGNRDHGMLDGVAMVQGPNMPPVQRMWRNPVTGDVEPAAARLDGSLRERIDRVAVPDQSDRDGFIRSSAKRSKTSKRRYRARKTAERMIRERVQSRGEKFVPKGRMADPVKAELQRLRKGGAELPARGW
jgi:hypothetical protein